MCYDRIASLRLVPAAVVGNDAMMVEGGRLTDYKIRLPVTMVEGGRLAGFKIRLPVSVVEVVRHKIRLPVTVTWDVSRGVMNASRSRQ